MKNKQFVLGFLRGLFDTDGTLSGRKVLFYTSSNGLKNQIRKFLGDFEIKNSAYLDRRSRSPIYHIYIWKQDIEKFIKLIKPFGI